MERGVLVPLVRAAEISSQTNLEWTLGECGIILFLRWKDDDVVSSDKEEVDELVVELLEVNTARWELLLVL
jgi:hypothetical protein